MRPARAFVLLASLLLPACDHLVTIDVDCDKLCLTSPGPTLPGLDHTAPAGLDAGILDAPLDTSLAPSADQPAGLPPMDIQWFAEVPFDEALKQLPISTFDLSLNVRISSMHLTSTTDLSFVDAVDVFLERPRSQLDGGMAAIDSDGGTDDGGEPTSSPCGLGSAPLQVARFRRADVSASDPDPDLDLTVMNRNLNLADCMKDSPALFDVRLGVLPTAYPASDVPLALGSCIEVKTGATYP